MLLGYSYGIYRSFDVVVYCVCMYNGIHSCAAPYLDGHFCWINAVVSYWFVIRCARFHVNWASNKMKHILNENICVFFGVGKDFKRKIIASNGRQILNSIFGWKMRDEFAHIYFLRSIVTNRALWDIKSAFQRIAKSIPVRHSINFNWI